MEFHFFQMDGVRSAAQIENVNDGNETQLRNGASFLQLRADAATPDSNNANQSPQKKVSRAWKEEILKYFPDTSFYSVERRNSEIFS